MGVALVLGFQIWATAKFERPALNTMAEEYQIAVIIVYLLWALQYNVKYWLCLVLYIYILWLYCIYFEILVQDIHQRFGMPTILVGSRSHSWL